MHELPLPPDLERLQTIRAWIAEQRAAQATLNTFLDVLAETLDAAVAAAAPAGEPAAYRIQKMRVPEGRAVLHRSDCWMSGGGAISREEALMALADDALRGRMRLCTACRPGETLGV